MRKCTTTKRVPHEGRAKQATGTQNRAFKIVPEALEWHQDQGLIRRIIESGNQVSYAKGSVLFSEGESSRGIFLLLAGSVKLSAASYDGKVFVFGLCGQGTILGLAATVLDRTCDASAESLEPTNAIFVPRDAFLELLREDASTTFEAAALLSLRCFNLIAELKNIGLSKSAQQRLATLLLGFRGGSKDNEVSIRLAGAREEELAQMAGVSRETASRFLSRLKKRRVLHWRRSTLVIRNWAALEELATSSGATKRS